MPKSHRPYPSAFRRQMIKLAKPGRTPEELGRQFEPSAQAIRNWVKQASLDAGQRADGLTMEEREELRRLRRDNRPIREERAILAKAATCHPWPMSSESDRRYDPESENATATLRERLLRRALHRTLWQACRVPVTR